MLTIRGVIDAIALEDILLDRVQARGAGGLDAPLLLLVPTRRLADHLRKRIVDRAGATLGLWLFTHRAFARHVVEFSLEVPPQILPTAGLGELVEALLESYDGVDRDYLRKHAGARNALLAAVRELRDAGVAPKDLERPPVSAAVSATVMKFYPRYTAALEALGRDDLADERALIERAIPCVPRFLERKGIRRAVHYGAYELIGCHCEIVDAIAAYAELEFLLPGEPSAPASKYAWRFESFARRRVETNDSIAADHLVAVEEPETQPPPARARFLERIARIGDPEAIWTGEIDEPALEVRHCQGAATELRVAALRALALHHNEGIPLDEIAIVARSLESYAPFLEPSFEDLGVPFETSVTLSVRRLPGVASFLQLLRVLATDFERQATIDLFRANRPRIEGLEKTPFHVSRWDRWSRAARIVKGPAEWKSLSDFVARLHARRTNGTNGNGAALEEDRSSVATLLAALGELEEDRKAWRAAGRIAGHAAVLEDLFNRRVAQRTGSDPDPSAAIVAKVLETLATVAKCRAVAGGETTRYSIEEVESLVQRLVDAESLPIERGRNAGVRVLDLMQARGLVHRVVIWIGFQHGLFPRPGRQSPYLTDAARECIASAYGKVLPPKAVTADEERLLLATTLTSARERVVISFQRADDDGRRRARSSALRDVARVFLGQPDTAALLNGAPSNPFRPQRIAAHPEEYVLEVVGSAQFGLCAVDDALIAQSVRRDSSFASVRRILRDTKRTIDLVDASLEAVECLEEFAPSDRKAYRFDGCTGLAAPVSSYRSPTAVDRLAGCPLSFFLRDVLGVRELEKEAQPYRVERAALGSAVHDTLQTLYSKLVREHGLPLATENFAAVQDGVLSSLQALWGPALKRAAGPSYERLKGLYAILEARWLAELRRFVERDLGELRDAAVERIDLEKDVRRDLELADSVRVSFDGRLDRILYGAAFVSIDDYKTGGKLREWVQPNAILRGERLQLPLYAEMIAVAENNAGHELQARLLGVGPEIADSHELALLPPMATIREGFRETLATVVSLAKIGYFPANPDAKICRFCNYRRTCRKSLEPTRHRFTEDDELRDYRDCGKKARERQTLTEVRKYDAELAQGAARRVVRGETSRKETVDVP